MSSRPGDNAPSVNIKDILEKANQNNSVSLVGLSEYERITLLEH